jgi:hypothetical protein
MAGNKVTITLPRDLGEITVDNIASEDTLKDLVKALNASKGIDDKNQKKQADALKKINEALGDQEDSIEESIEASKKEQVAKGKLSKATTELWTATKEGTKELASALGDLVGASINQFAKYLSKYDEMAMAPVDAGRDMLQFMIDMTQQVASLAVGVVSGGLQAMVGWIPMVGDGLRGIVGKIEGVAQDILTFAGDIATFVNELLAKEFNKRIETLNMYAASFVSIAGGLSDVAALAGGAALPIKIFGEAVTKARPYLTEIGLAGGDAAKLISRAMGALATSTGKGGRALRDEMFAMGISFADQGAMMAQYMAQMKSLGKDVKNIPMSTLAQGTAEYAKHLRVLSDLTGQDASQLLAQARAEAQRGALMETLTANQARAFQDSFAIFSTLPQQQGAKLQSALAQLLAGGVVTDPIIAGNAIIMDMLQKTAMQVGEGNINMVTATQTNLAQAADDYRAAGESVTDFATLMSPTGTGAVAQGMSQFGNALRQYRYDPGAAQAALQQTEAMAQASGEMVGITETMMGFQMQMEGLAGSALPMYTEAMMWATEQTMDVVTDGIDYLKAMMEAGADVTKQLAAITNLIADLLNAPKKPTGVVGEVLGKVDEGLGRTASNFTEMIPDISLREMLTAADGNVFEGPKSGYPAILHGTEAVVPLPDGRTIPVEIKNPGQADNSAINNLTAVMTVQNTKMDELIGLMQRNNNLTSGILQASM